MTTFLIVVSLVLVAAAIRFYLLDKEMNEWLEKYPARIADPKETVATLGYNRVIRVNVFKAGVYYKKRIIVPKAWDKLKDAGLQRALKKTFKGYKVFEYTSPIGMSNPLDVLVVPPVK